MWKNKYHGSIGGVQLQLNGALKDSLKIDL